MSLAARFTPSDSLQAMKPPPGTWMSAGVFCIIGGTFITVTTSLDEPLSLSLNSWTFIASPLFFYILICFLFFHRQLMYFLSTSLFTFSMSLSFSTARRWVLPEFSAMQPRTSSSRRAQEAFSSSV